MQRLIYAFVLWLPVVCSAQLTGQFQFSFTNDLPLWDITGEYSYANGGLGVDYSLAHAPNGALTGTGAAHLDEGLTDIAATEVTQGRVKGTGSGVSINATGQGQFTGTILGRNLSGPFNSSLSLVIDPSNRVILGTVSGSLCVRGFGCRTLETNVSFTLPDEMTGAWMLTLDVVTSNHVARGTATAQLANGRTLAFKAKGRFRPATGLTVVTLRGTGGAFGLRLPITLGADGSLQRLGGKLFGQKLAFP